MALKLKFLDSAKAKEMVLQKGERVGLAVAVVISFFILCYGLWTGFSSGGPPAQYETSNWRDAIMKKAEQLDAKVKKSTPPTEGEKIEVKADWPTVQPSYEEPAPWVVLADGGDSKRRNPPVVKLRHEKEYMQIDYHRAPVLMHQNYPNNRKVTALTPKGATATGTDFRLAELLQPKRMVIVSAMFPLKDQLELIRHALRLYTIEEAMQPENAPKFIGLNVARCEIMPNGKAKEKAKGKVDWQPLYTYDPKKDLKQGPVFKLADSLTPIFRDCVIDETNFQLHANWVYRGLSTPLPKLAVGPYPAIDLDSIKTPKVAGEAGLPGMPSAPPGGGGLGLPGPGGSDAAGPGEGGGMMAAQGPEMNYTQIAWTDVEKMKPELGYRLKGYFHAFDPLGSWGGKDLTAGGFGPGGSGVPGAGGEMGLGGTGPGGTAPGPGEGEDRTGEGRGPAAPGTTTTEIGNLLARFIDVDVEPGKTYVYSVRVIMVNPNYGLKDKVAYVTLANQKELYSDWTFTPPVTIPGDYFYYAFNWQPGKQEKLEAPVIRDGSDHNLARPDTHPIGGAPALQMSIGQAPIQIHQWVGVTPERRALGDWAIAERVLVHRGQTIYRPAFMAEMPVWDPQRQGYWLESTSIYKKGKAKWAPGKATGIPIDFKVESGNNPVLVDFVEGNKFTRYVGKTPINDEAAQDVLIMTPDGRLIVRNARDDTFRDTEDGKERQKRFDNWIGRIQFLRQAGDPNMQAPGGPGEPGR